MNRTDKTRDSIDEGSSCFFAMVADDLDMLASLHGEPMSRERILALWENCYCGFLGMALQSARGKQALAMFRRGVTDIPAYASEKALEALQADYSRVYLCRPLQSPMLRVLAFADAATDTAHLNAAETDPWRRDDMASRLRYLACQIRQGGQREALDAIIGLMDCHFLEWANAFFQQAQKDCATRFYAGLQQLTQVYLEELRAELGHLSASRPPFTLASYLPKPPALRHDGLPADR